MDAKYWLDLLEDDVRQKKDEFLKLQTWYWNNWMERMVL